MLKAALCGGYVNFGVFSLYGDDALEKALKTFVELLSSIPHSNLLVRRLYSYLFWGFGSVKEASGIGYTTYMGKPKIPVGKSNGSRYSFGEAHRKIKGVMTPKNRVKILGTE